MSAHTRYVVVFLPLPDDLTVTTIEGVYAEKQHALDYVRELHVLEGLPLAAFEVEGWRGRDFQGVWDYTGTLVEDRKGRVRDAQTGEVK